MNRQAWSTAPGMSADSDRPDPRPASRWAQLRARLAGLWAGVRRRFSVDLRALAVMRMVLGAVIVGDLIHRAQHLRFFYTDEGVYPLAAFTSTYVKFNDLSLHALSGEAWVQAALFVLAGALAVAFALGYRTRWTGLASFVLLVSLQARNPHVLNAGDRLLRILLLVALVTPLGERWSLDALRREETRRTVAGPATAALLVQPIVVFTANAVLKHPGDHWYAGDGLQIALANDAVTLPLGKLLTRQELVTTALTYGWVGLLAGSSLLLLATTGRLRAAAALAYVGAFIGMMATMAVGLFPFVLVAALVPFLTTPVWEAVTARVPPRWRDRWPPPALVDPSSRPSLTERLAARLPVGEGRDPQAGLASTGRSVRAVAGLALLAWMLVFSGAHVTDTDLPDAIDDPNLDVQRWGVFAPDPATAYSWYETEAQLADGRSVDAHDGDPFGFERPAHAGEAFETFRHRKYMGHVKDSEVLPGHYVDWACQHAQQVVDGDVDRVRLHRSYQPSPLDGTYEDPTRIVVAERAC
jgi:hypothetical protein